MLFSDYFLHRLDQDNWEKTEDENPGSSGKKRAPFSGSRDQRLIVVFEWVICLSTPSPTDLAEHSSIWSRHNIIQMNTSVEIHLQTDPVIHYNKKQSSREQ